MAIPKHERERILAVRLRGPRVIARLEAIGITKLEELAERDPLELVHQVNVAAGRPIWHSPMATPAMSNLIDAARNEDPRSRVPKNPLDSVGTSGDRNQGQPA
jgi:hypothetical protein